MKPGCICCAGGVLGSPGQPFPQFGYGAGDALKAKAKAKHLRAEAQARSALGLARAASPALEVQTPLGGPFALAKWVVVEVA
ncbi:unnamed protein product [Prunus armeniaca]